MSHKIDCLECFIAGERQGEETGSLVERERIIKLLEEQGEGCDCVECGSNNDLGHYWYEIELIKGEK